MEAVLTNDDVRSIWSRPLTVVVQSVDQAAGDYSLATLTDGTVHAPALLQGQVRPGHQLELTRHRVQWINGERYWVVMAWTDNGATALPAPTRPVRGKPPTPPAPPPAATEAHPFLL